MKTFLLIAFLTWAVAPSRAQQLDLSHGGSIDITASDGIEWRQADRVVIARGNAQAIRGNVTVRADRLTAWYRKRDAQSSTQLASASKETAENSAEGSEIYRLKAEGHVIIFTSTDRAEGDAAVYDLDKAVLIMTGRNLRLTTPNDTLTARDDLEYWPNKHMAVARGDAAVVTTDAKRVAADTLVAYMAPGSSQPKAPGRFSSPVDGQPSGSGKLERVEAFGNVSIRTPTDMVTGGRGVYLPDIGKARLDDHVQITRGQSQLNGGEADVDMKTGVAILLANQGSRVHGLIVPNTQGTKSLPGDESAAKSGSEISDSGNAR